MAELRKNSRETSLSPPDRHKLTQRQMKSRYIRVIKRKQFSKSHAPRTLTSDDSYERPVINDAYVVRNTESYYKQRKTAKGSIQRNEDADVLQNRERIDGKIHAYSFRNDSLSAKKPTAFLKRDIRSEAGRKAVTKKAKKQQFIRSRTIRTGVYTAAELKSNAYKNSDSNKPDSYAEEKVRQTGRYIAKSTGTKLLNSYRPIHPSSYGTRISSKTQKIDEVRVHIAGSFIIGPELRLSRENAAGVIRGRNLAIRDYANRTGNGIRSASQAARRAVKATLEASKIQTAAISVAALCSTAVMVIISVVLVLAMTISSAFGEYNLELSDNDLVNIALSQVGTESGEEYCKWYGYDHEVGWCAIFVSWCGTEAGLVKKGLMPKFAWVPTGVYWFQARDQWHSKGYAPEPGDIIFFDWYDYDLDEDGEEIGQDGSADHVGIVEKVEGGYVYTVEGNTTEEGVCKEKRYPLGYFEILGFGEVIE